MDRKRVPADWRKRVAAIRARISKEFPSLPKDSDPFFQTLDPEGSNFMPIFKIYAIYVMLLCVDQNVLMLFVHWLWIINVNFGWLN